MFFLLQEDELQKDFIRSCLKQKPEDRPTARELLFHPILFEVHSLKLLAAHNLVNSPGKDFDQKTSYNMEINKLFQVRFRFKSNVAI